MVKDQARETLSDQIIDFLFKLRFSIELPAGVEVMHPFLYRETRRVASIFYHKYYHDNDPRYCIIGINPGRFGAGVTGVPFTDPVRLEKECGIDNDWPRKAELSSIFIYDMINAFGGTEGFYKNFYFTAMSPLGFTRNGKNLNYYDDKSLEERIIPFAIDCFRTQINWGLHTTVAFCLGEGTNFKSLNNLNKRYSLFEKIIPLSHPRFIMQYKLKTKDLYISKYLKEFRAVI
jgi:hypothetical protein